MKLPFTSALFFLSQILCAQITVQISTTNVSCYGGSNASAIAVAHGGSTPYTYNWSNGASKDTITGLPFGTYIVTVTDNNGLTAVKSTVITQPPLLGAVLNGQPQICSIKPDGFSYAIPTGGSSPFSFSWNNGVSTQLNNFLTSGTYTVTVTDTRGCTATSSYEVGFLGIGLYLIKDVVNASCPQPFNGSASVSALSGNGPYFYQWNTGENTPVIDSLSEGAYQVTVSDVNGCSASVTVAVEIENVASNSVNISIPQCVGTTYLLESSEGYHEYLWSFSDPLDSIISAEGSQVVVKWGAPGQKQVTVFMSDSLTQCSTSTLFHAAVYECAVNVEESFLENIQVGPNPFNEFIALNQGGTELPFANIQLFNLQGALLMQQISTGSASLLDTKSLAPGIYLLKLSDGRSTRVWKMVKA